MLKGDNISERILEFSSRIIKLSNALPKSVVGKHICQQIIRSGTSAGANYEEARGAESKADFTHKLGITLKELRETKYWLKLITHSNLIDSKRMLNIVQETDELCKIVGKSILTLKNKK